MGDRGPRVVGMTPSYTHTLSSGPVLCFDGSSSCYTVLPSGEIASSERGAAIDRASVMRYLASGFDPLRAISASVSYPQDDAGEEESLMLYGG